MEIAKTTEKPRKWYNSYKFPLVPQFKYRPANEHNTPSWSFDWLIFRFWTLDSTSFEIAFVCSGHWGIGFNGILPYLRWVIAIPLPQKLDEWIYRHFTRKPKSLTTPYY